MKKYLIIGLLISLMFNVNAQVGHLVMEGKYYGESLFVYNPSVGDTFSVQYIIINEDTVTDELNANAIEIDFGLLKFELEAEIVVEIVYDSTAKPLVVNPNALFPPNPFKFSKPRIKEDKVQWFVYGDIADYPIEIQHKRWDEWVTVSEVDPLDTLSNRFYSTEVDMHSGYNEFRLITQNMKGDLVYSKEIAYRPPSLKQVVIQEPKIEKEIVFSRETIYEIYTLDGKLLKKGKDRYVDVSDLEKGKYYLRFDNRGMEIKKRR